MECAQICRICLVGNVKMFHLHSHPLRAYFEHTIGTSLLNIMKLPSYACYECAALMKKYYYFKEKCLKGQTELCKILNTSGKITEQELQRIDRLNLGLSSDISIQHLDEPIYHVYQENDCTIPCNIKVEKETDCKFYYEIEAVKEEHSDDFRPSSDDDGLLSQYKTNKEEKKTKKKVKRKLIEDKTDSKSELAEVQKPKRGRMKKLNAPPSKALERKSKRTKNTTIPSEDDIDLTKCVTIFQLSTEEQLEEIKNRQQSSNFQNAPYQCNLCYRGFVHTQAWEHHLLKHDPSAGDIECPICKIRFKTKRTLKNHAVHYHEKKFVCNCCPYVSKNVLQAKLHQRWHDGVTYKCPYCSELSTKWTSYLSHVRTKHPSEFICGVCGYSFVSKSGLNMHKRLMHKDITEKVGGDGGTEPGPYCKECDVRFVSVEAWKRHTVTSVKHTQVAHFNNGCRMCGETFKSSEDLRTHHRKEHARKQPKYYKKRTNITYPAKCEHCLEEIPTARQYWIHYRRMHPDKNYPIQRNYVCDICGKGFPNNAVLVYHKRTHSEGQFKCGTCGKAFHNRANLQTHETQTHSDLRPFPCALCNKAFKCKGALSRHSRCHTGAKPYTCELCGKSFSQSNSRKLHVSTVHLKQPAPPRARRRPASGHAPPTPPTPHATAADNIADTDDTADTDHHI